MASAMRELSHLAVVIENAAAAKEALASGGRRNAKHSRAGRPGKRPGWPSPEEMFEIQQRGRREQEMVMHQAHEAARAAKAAALAPTPEPEPVSEEARRINAIAESFYAGHRRGPRIRGL